MKLKNIDHIVLTTQDLGACPHFYVDIIGLELDRSSDRYGLRFGNQKFNIHTQKAASLGPVKYFIDTAGASPNQTTPQRILELDMVGTGYAVDAFGKVRAKAVRGLLSQARPGTCTVFRMKMNCRYFPLRRRS